MKYLVMECRLGYAIVLDKEGTFFKVANLGYEVGQIVDDVIKERDWQDVSSSISAEPEKEAKQKFWSKRRRRMAPLLAVCACLCLMLFGGERLFLTSYGTVRIQINPDVMVSMNRFQYVVDISGINADGEILIADYRYFGKKVTEVSTELADLAKEMGYLDAGGEITVTVTGTDESWQIEAEEQLVTGLQHHCGGSAQVKAAHEGETEGHHNSDATETDESGHYEAEKVFYEDADAEEQEQGENGDAGGKHHGGNKERHREGH